MKEETTGGTVSRNTGNITRNAHPVSKMDVQGPVPQKHRNRLGQADGSTNPYGNGEPSKVSTVQNSVKGW